MSSRNAGRNATQEVRPKKCHFCGRTTPPQHASTPVAASGNRGKTLVPVFIIAEAGGVPGELAFAEYVEDDGNSVPPEEIELPKQSKRVGARRHR